VLAAADVPEELHPLYARLMGILDVVQSQQQQQQQDEEEEEEEQQQQGAPDPPEDPLGPAAAPLQPVNRPVLAAQMAGLAAQLLQAAFQQHAATAAAGLLGRDPPEPLADYSGHVSHDLAPISNQVLAASHPGYFTV
jgi:hypothetical protein